MNHPLFGMRPGITAAKSGIRRSIRPVQDSTAGRRKDVTAEPHIGRRLGTLDKAQVVLGPGRFGHVNGDAALAGEPGERQVLRVEIVVIVCGVTNIDGQFARAEVGRRRAMSAGLSWRPGATPQALCHRPARRMLLHASGRARSRIGR